MTAHAGPWFDDGFDDEPTREVLLEVDDADLLPDAPDQSVLVMSLAGALLVSCALAGALGAIVARVHGTPRAAYETRQPHVVAVAEARETITLAPPSAPNKMLTAPRVSRRRALRWR